MAISFGSPSYAFSSRSKPFLFGSRLSNPISIRLVLLSLVVMPVAVLVLPLDVDGHAIRNEYGLYWRTFS
jgi:hypothetical protein